MAEHNEHYGDNRLYLDDLHVGQRFTGKSHAVDEAQIKAFARQFDPQPFHLDDEAVKSTLFADLAVSGWHTAAITMRLLVEGGEISWPKPTRPGDILQVKNEVLEVALSRSRPNRDMVPIRSETRNQRSDVVQVFAAKLVVPRRTGAQT